MFKFLRVMALLVILSNLVYAAYCFIVANNGERGKEALVSILWTLVAFQLIALLEERQRQRIRSH